MPITRDPHRTLSVAAEEPAGLIGIDTVRARGPIAGQRKAFGRHWRRFEVDGQTGEVLRPHEGSGGRLPSGGWLGVDSLRRRLEGVIEMSVPNYVRGDNTRPASITEVHAALTDVVAETADLVEWECDPADLTLTRMDLVRDFVDVLEPRVVLAALELQPALRATTHAYRDESCQGVATLYREARRWKLRAYDREYAYRRRLVDTDEGDRRGDLARLAERECGKIRAEVELRSEALSEAGMRGLHQLDQGLLDAAGEYFIVDRGRICVPVGGTPSELRAIGLRMHREGRGGLFQNILGHFTVEILGLPPMKSGDTIRKYRSEAEKHGITAAMVLQTTPTLLPAGALNFRAGRYANLYEPPTVSVAA